MSHWVNISFPLIPTGLEDGKEKSREGWDGGSHDLLHDRDWSSWPGRPWSVSWSKPSSAPLTSDVGSNSLPFGLTGSRNASSSAGLPKPWMTGWKRSWPWAMSTGKDAQAVCSHSTSAHECLPAKASLKTFLLLSSFTKRVPENRKSLPKPVYRVHQQWIPR